MSEAPKELMDCILSDEILFSLILAYSNPYKLVDKVAKAQLEKVQPYIEAQIELAVQRDREEMGYIKRNLIL